MFQPNFEYTSKMVNTLVEITSARDMIVNSYIIPKLELSLRRDALIKSAHASTAIEGNPLNLDDVDRLLQGQRVIALEKSKQEVINYLDVLQNIGDYQEDGKITEQMVLKLHRDVNKKTLDDPSYEGRYRDVQVYVVNRMKEIIFTPPPPYEVSKQMKNFIEWLKTIDTANIHPVIVAGISHYEFVRIHPFVDGNGRTARVLATLILYLKEFDIKRFFTLDEFYDNDRTAYYAALNSVDQETLDITHWLEYFLDGVLSSISKIKEEILLLSPDQHKKGLKGQIELGERQVKIMEKMNINGKITSTEIQDMFKISRQAAHKELKKLLELDLIERKGASKATYYTFK